jgi:hypothetical protein
MYLSMQRERLAKRFVLGSLLLVASCEAPAGGDRAGGTRGGGTGGAGGSAGGGGSGGPAGSGGGGIAGAGGSGGAGSGDARAEAAAEGGGAGGTTGAGGSAGSARFSFFYTSLDAMRRLSGKNDGFGGDLRFGTANGLEGADKICQTIAQAEGAGGKTWKAFLSAVRGADGQPVHAIDRVGNGPWYDRNGRLIAMNPAGLVVGNRPAGDGQAVADLPDEKGRGTRMIGDTHDVITASNRMGRLRSTNLASTCQDWTSASGGSGIGAGHSWPASSGMNWMEAHPVPNCTPSVNTTFTPNGLGIGGYGGWGGFYCFALTP